MVHELQDQDEEEKLAAVSSDEVKPREWCDRFEIMLRGRIESLTKASDGWTASQRTADALHELDRQDTQKGNTARRHDLYQGRFEGDGKEEWLDWARLEMMKV